MKIKKCENRKFWYECNSGDSVEKLAERFNLSPYKLVKDNGLKRQPKKGELLIIESGNVIMFEPTDDIRKVLTERGIDEGDIKEKNGIEYLPINIYLSC